MAKIRSMVSFILDTFKDNWDGKGAKAPSTNIKDILCNKVVEFLQNNYTHPDIDCPLMFEEKKTLERTHCIEIYSEYDESYLGIKLYCENDGTSKAIISFDPDFRHTHSIEVTKLNCERQKNKKGFVESLLEDLKEKSEK